MAASFFEFGDELHPLGPELGEERVRDVATVPKEVPPQAASKLRDGLAVITVPWSESDGQEVPTVVNDQMDFEAIEPARARDAALSYVLENLMRFATQMVTYLQGCGVEEGEPCAAAQAGGEKSRQGQQGLRLSLDKARIADKVRKGAGQIPTDRLEIEGLQSPKAGGLQEEENGHHFAYASP